MKDSFCNRCHLTIEIPALIANKVLGEDQLYGILFRYQQMRGNYDLTYSEWQKVFTDDLKPFNGYTDTTSTVIPISHPQFGADIATLHKGAIGVDLPTWFNIQPDNRHIMIVAQDPLRSVKWYGECRDAVLSSPFGQQDYEHRHKANGGEMMHLLVKELVINRYGVYLTDANKYFIYDHETTDEFSANHINAYTNILKEEIDLVKPMVIVCLGRSSERMCKKIGLPNILALPHLSGTARGAIVRKFPRLEEIGATAENIAKEYANEIIRIVNR